MPKYTVTKTVISTRTTTIYAKNFRQAEEMMHRELFTESQLEDLEEEDTSDTEWSLDDCYEPDEED